MDGSDVRRPVAIQKVTTAPAHAFELRVIQSRKVPKPQDLALGACQSFTLDVGFETVFPFFKTGTLS